MSGSGKSRWSKKLAEKGFQRICCDDLIEKDLSSELEKHGVRGIQDVARWMGYPYEKQFKRNQAMYFKSEAKIMKKVIKCLKNGIKRSTVVDTTGSVIYSGGRAMKELKKYSLVIYLETPMSALPEMLRIFMEKPKPVIWRNMFQKNKNETNKEALRRCYPKLLRERVTLYKKYADTVLRYKIRRHTGFTVDDLIKFAQKSAMEKNS